MIDSEFDANVKKYDRARDRGDDDVAAGIATLLAETGDAIWQCLLGLHYEAGLGLEEDQQAALVWFQKSADQRFSLATFYLGAMYLFGNGVAQDLGRGLCLFEEAAVLGYVGAEFTLGTLYSADKTLSLRQELEFGLLGVDFVTDSLTHTDRRLLPIDRERSYFWFRRAAEQGFPDAQYAVGQAYQTGEGVKTDLASAFLWFLKAAKQGVAKAQFEVANACAEGLGTARDRRRSERWMKQAAKRGHRKAIMLLESTASSRKEWSAQSPWSQLGLTARTDSFRTFRECRTRPVAPR